MQRLRAYLTCIKAQIHSTEKGANVAVVSEAENIEYISLMIGGIY